MSVDLQPMVQIAKDLESERAGDFSEAELRAGNELTDFDDFLKDEMENYWLYGEPASSGSRFRFFSIFRWMGYAFFGLTVYAIFATIFNGYTKDWYGMFMNFVLIVSSFIVASTSYCREGLSNEVAVFTQQNDELVAQTASLTNQIKDVEFVKQKYQSVLEDLQGDEDMLKDIVSCLHRDVLMKNLQSVFRALTDIDVHGGRLSAKEADEFFSKTWAVLRQPAGDFEAESSPNALGGAFPLDELYDQVVNADVTGHCSLDRGDIKLLIYACSLSGDTDRPHASKALLWLVLFSFNPEIHVQSLTESLILTLLGVNAMPQDEEELSSLVDTIKASHSGAFKIAEDKKCLMLVDRILHGRSIIDPSIAHSGVSRNPTPAPTPRRRS